MQIRYIAGTRRIEIILFEFEHWNHQTWFTQLSNIKISKTIWISRWKIQITTTSASALVDASTEMKRVSKGFALHGYLKQTDELIIYFNKAKRAQYQLFVWKKYSDVSILCANSVGTILGYQIDTWPIYNVILLTSCDQNKRRRSR
jgi:hypothetical protein